MSLRRRLGTVEMRNWKLSPVANLPNRVNQVILAAIRDKIRFRSSQIFLPPTHPTIDIIKVYYDFITIVYMRHYYYCLVFLNPDLRGPTFGKVLVSEDIMKYFVITNVT